jgi:hypothetical protein
MALGNVYHSPKYVSPIEINMSDPLWVTYAEAAERLGISVEGVRPKVKRDQKLGKDAKLRVHRDNSGRMLLAWDEALLDMSGR